jgi:hypothetical protein
MSLPAILAALQASEGLLQRVDLTALITFIRVSTTLKKDILLVQPSNHNPSIAPRYLSKLLINFLTACSGISNDDVEACWLVLKDFIWGSQLEEEVEGLYMVYRVVCVCDLSIASLNNDKGKQASTHTLWPPSSFCLNTNCDYRHNGRKLQTANQPAAVLYTLAHGAVPIHAVNFTCQGKASLIT